MSSSKPPSPGNTLSGGNVQNKADILENNLYNCVSAKDDPFLLQLSINRQQSPDPVIVKALTQLFSRLNIRGSQVLILIRRVLMKKIPEHQEIKLSKRVLNLAETGNPETAHLSITLTLIASAKKLAMELKGVRPRPSRDGAVEQAFFDFQSCPGAFREDGTIDFREINSYPIVKAGDNLFLITPEVQGRSGIQYDGTIIPVPEAQPMTINIKGGVDLVDSMTSGGDIQGSYLRAAKTGAVLLDKNRDGTLTDIEIRDTLDVSRLDYSVGNIGTHFVCPVSMKIDTICNGFKIRTKGTIEVGELEGGHIDTENTAIIHTAHAGSTVRAAQDIVVHFCRGAQISSAKGYVSITDEVVDSALDARGIRFEKYKGIFTGCRLDAEQIELKNILICGENRINFGRRLAGEKQTLEQARKKLAEDGEARVKDIGELMAKLNENIKALSALLKSNPLLRDNLKALILATQSMDYPTLYRELETIGQAMTTREGAHIRKCLDSLRQIDELSAVAASRDEAMAARIIQIEGELDEMSLILEIFLRRASTLRIILPDSLKKDPDRPDIFIESHNEKDTLVKVYGKYSRTKGFEFSGV